MSPPRLLNTSLLEDLRARWTAQGAPIVNHLRPGLSKAEMEETVAPLGLRLPAEARVWWGWHNGVPAQSGPQERSLGPHRAFLPLEEAVPSCIRIRDMTVKVTRDVDQDPEELWPRSWLPIVESGVLVVLDTAVADDSPAPVHVHYFDEGPQSPDARSFGDLVAMWIQALDAGEWVYDRERELWRIQFGRVEPQLEKRGLV